uniref:Uncharacterized protein n=1 Tax=Amphimedon queenslandica TaxID=400682 RepID=A0A1X7UAY3_AMPQE
MDNVNYAPQVLKIVDRQDQNEDVLYDTVDQNRITTARIQKCLPQRKQPVALAFMMTLQVLMLILLIAAILTVYMVCPSNGICSDGDGSMGNVVSNSSNMQGDLGTAKLSQKLDKVAETLSVVSNTTISVAEVVEEIFSAVQSINDHNDNSSSKPLLTSCQEMKKQLNSPSGYYDINSKSTYCNMGELCGSTGWTRLAYLNMSDASQNCPSGLRLYQSGGVRACGRPVSNGGSCASVQFPSNGIRYSQICGRVVGYQYGTTDGSFDGVTITHGFSQQLVWTLMAELFDSSLLPRCPCNSGQLVLGGHFFCESGNHDHSFPVRRDLFISDPLWDGQGCGPNEVSCCSAPGIPWFHRDYGNTTSTTDYIELKICCNEGTHNEDVPVGFYEIYVK